MDFVLTSADNGTTIPLHPGNTGELRLPETPTTGYRWTIDSTPPYLVIKEGEFSAVSSPTIGGGGERRWVIQAKTTGSATLTLKRWRDWEGESSVVERYQVTLSITT
jgi:inhibitor of cysteine peptidase